MNSVCSAAPARYLELEPNQEQLQERAAIPRTLLNGSMKFEQLKMSLKQFKIRTQDT